MKSIVIEENTPGSFAETLDDLLNHPPPAHFFQEIQFSVVRNAHGTMYYVALVIFGDMPTTP